MDYHALNQHNYFSYPGMGDTAKMMQSPIYSWKKHWSSTNTLMDMFGQKLPVVCTEEDELKFYNNAYWNLSVQPTFEWRTLAIGQAVFDPILNMQPFVIIGGPLSLRLLKSLGYKTFSRYVNENYDDDAEDETRMQSLFRMTYEMSFWTPAELAVLSNKLQPILKHNQSHLLSSKKFKLMILLNTLKYGNRSTTILADD